MGSSVDYRELYKAYEASWASQDWQAWLTTLDAGYQFSIGGVVVGGAAETLAWSKGVFAAIPNYRQRVERVVLEGDIIVVEAVGEGMASGGMPLIRGAPMPEPGARVTLPYVKVLRFGAAGLVEDRQYHDTAQLLQQLRRQTSP